MEQNGSRRGGVGCALKGPPFLETRVKKGVGGGTETLPQREGRCGTSYWMTPGCVVSGCGGLREAPRRSETAVEKGTAVLELGSAV